jgi:hypothetical protein
MAVGERIEEIESKAAAGDAAAQIALAQQCDEDGKNEEAVAWLRRAVATGNRAAKTALAQHLVSRAPYNVFEGIRWALEAIHDGDAEAAHLLAVVAAEGLGMPQSWHGALDYLVKAAESGHALAQGELAALAGRWDIAEALAAGTNAPSQDWRRLRQAIDMAAWLTAPRAREMSQSPRMAVAEKFLPAPACDWLIERARPQTRRAAVFDVERGGHQLLDTRSNTGAYLNVAQMDMVTVAARARIAALSGLPLGGFEDSAILHYGAGEEYKPHYDFLDATPAMAPEIANGGQRVATLLIYLNEGYEGGETDFPSARRRFKGRKGDALIFWNVTPNGQPDPLTLHAGLPPKSGEKWLFSQWIRLRVA